MISSHAQTLSLSPKDRGRDRGRDIGGRPGLSTVSLSPKDRGRDRGRQRKRQRKIQRKSQRKTDTDACLTNYLTCTDAASMQLEDCGGS